MKRVSPRLSLARTAIYTLLFATGLFAAGFAAAGCTFPGSKSPYPTGASAIYTAAAHTVEARLTQVGNPPATNGATPIPSRPDGGLIPAGGLTPASATSRPAVSPAPQTAVPPTLDPGCDQAGFVRDVTVPDHSELSPGESFVKTWRLENRGECTWTEEYALVFSEGEAMGAPALVNLPQAVPPGETVDLSLTLTAPQQVGSYRGDWRLRNAAGTVFGIGEEAKPFWVQVDVITASGVVVDFISQASSAQWTSGIGNSLTNPLNFGGEEGASAGTARTVDERPLENGATSSTVLLTAPYRDPEGAVRGVFPEYTVQPGDRLKARLGLLTPSGDCSGGDVVFEINYLEGDEMHELGEWEKGCEGSLLPVDLDLSDLQGKTVRFVLTVRANGEAREDWAVWSSARVEH